MVRGKPKREVKSRVVCGDYAVCPLLWLQASGAPELTMQLRIGKHETIREDGSPAHGGKQSGVTEELVLEEAQSPGSGGPLRVREKAGGSE